MLRFEVMVSRRRRAMAALRPDWNVQGFATLFDSVWFSELCETHQIGECIWWLKREQSKNK